LSRILVVDDESASRLVLKSRLAEQGYDVAIAESGARGLMEAREGSFDAILVSAALGSGVPGWEVCRRIKGAPSAGTVPVLLYSSTTVASDIMERAFEAGCSAFVIGHELPALEHQLKLAIKHRHTVLELADEARVLHEQLRRVQDERPRPHERDNGSHGDDHANALREIASGRPEGLMVVDAEGSVRQADRGASELLGMRTPGSHLGSLVPASGLEAFVRDARIEVREGYRFDLLPRKGHAPRSLSATVVPLVVHPGQHDHGLRIVLLYDAQKRKLAAEMLQIPAPLCARQELGALREAAREAFRPETLLGSSACIQSMRATLARMAQETEPVFITGEAGTGKERIARTIHYSSASTGAFVQVRCGALSPEMLELELFGCAKGALPNALCDRPGLVHAAQDGTLYLEEIGDMQPAAQRLVLRYLDERSILRRGATRAERMDVRIVASTSRSLDALVREGRFSDPLYQRFKQRMIELTPLASRTCDIPQLARHYVARFGARSSTHDLSDDALSLLQQYGWPGNVAELEESLEQACARAQNGTLQADDLPRALRETRREPVRDIIPAKKPHGPPVQGTHSADSPSSIPLGLVQPALPREPRQWDITEEDPVSFDVYERKVLLRALHTVDGDKLAAAKLLNVGKSTLYRKLKRYGIH
jgi:DNA-binding NtrC family response regulator